MARTASPEVIAFPRRDRVVLAVVVEEGIGPDFVPRMTVLAEDGARFPLPSDQVIARFPGALDAHPDGPPPDRLRKLRGEVERAVAWSEIHEKLPPGSTADFDQLSAALGAADVASRLRVALAIGSADPWLRRVAGGWLVVPRDEAVARIAAADAARRADREDASLRAWWPRRRSEPAPAGCAGAVAALRDFALRGDVPQVERGRLLSAHLELAEPDHVIEALVECGILPRDVNPAPWRAGLADGLPAAAVEEASRIAAAHADASTDGVAREDLTSLFTVSVDDDDTTEVDDALSVRRAGDDVEILVHISDAAAVVPMGGPLDDAARARASSLYVPDGALAMLPADLVAGRASLDEGLVRAAVTGIFLVRPDGTVASSRFVRSLVRVTKRLSYDATRDPSVLAASADDAAALVETAKHLREARIRGGATVTTLPSLKIHVESRDGALHPRVERRLQDTVGDLVVGETAVLYNAEAGRLLAARDVAALFRVQEPPRSADPDPANPLWPVLKRRRFAPTHLRVEPQRHHGVGHDAYAQATSPIRRYADLVNQRQLIAAAAGTPAPYRPGDLEVLAQQVADRERAVRRASGSREDYWLARWVEERGLRQVEGVLARVPRRGMGSVWVDELLTEVALRAPDRWKAPPEGTVAVWRIDRLFPWRGRIDVAPLG